MKIRNTRRAVIADLPIKSLRGADLHDQKLAGANLSGVAIWKKPLWAFLLVAVIFVCPKLIEFPIDLPTLSGIALCCLGLIYVDFMLGRFLTVFIGLLGFATLLGDWVHNHYDHSPLRETAIIGVLVLPLVIAFAYWTYSQGVYGIDMSGIKLDGADLSNAKIIRAKLTDASFNESILSNASFSESNLQAASFLKANLTRADLSGIDARNAAFTGADLTDSNLSFSDLRGATFKDAKLGGAKLHNARTDSKTSWPEGYTLSRN
jgi:uncharacterized protein YjbI with pentapeptide repeats